MLSSDLQFLVLHQLSWSQLIKHACTSKAHLRLVQAYLKCYPSRINHLYVLLLLLPDKPWDYHYLSDNHAVTWDMVADRPDQRWNYYLLSGNPNIPREMVYIFEDKPWKPRRSEGSALDAALASGMSLETLWAKVEADPDLGWDYCMLSEDHNIGA